MTKPTGEFTNKEKSKITPEQHIEALRDLQILYSETVKKNLVPRSFYRKNYKLGEGWIKYWNTYIDFRDAAFKDWEDLSNYVAEEQEDKPLTRDDISCVEDRTRKSKGKTYFVTSAVEGDDVNIEFLTSVLTFCKARNAELVILPMRGVRSKTSGFAKELEQHLDCFKTEIKFNKNLTAIDFLISPLQMNPLTSLNRYGQKSTSLIISSPKQQLSACPVGNSMLPHVLFSTGVATLPNYPHTRNGALSRQDHVCGGLIVEIQDSEIFHVRQVQADKDGGFYDLNKYYGYNKIKPGKALAVVLGDIHSGYTDSTATKAWEELIRTVSPEYIILHDVFDGKSISHHDQHNIEQQVNRPHHVATLEKELELLAETLKHWSGVSKGKNIVIVPSNHDMFLLRYLREGRYICDIANHRLALDLAAMMLDGLYPLEEYMYRNHMHSKKLKNIKWLKIDDDFKLVGVQLGSHGHLAPNGGKSGGAKSMENSYGSSICGHKHSPEILRSSWVVGTSSKLKLNYNEGPSSWLHASATLYENGMRQMIISISGMWRL